MDISGRTIGGYRVLERIGEGGMGTVYRAQDVMLDREVAIKAINPELARDAEIVARFRAEARLLARINHPAIATIYTFFESGDELFLAMEFVRGRSLARLLQEQGALSWERAVALLAAALDGIEQAHAQGIVHRDLKPENLMITDAGHVKVMDFGIARAAGSGRLTRTGLLIGTLRYMSPEQIRGEDVDERSDIYALGAVLYEMVTGRVPFDGSSDYAVLKAHVEEDPRPPSLAAAGLPAWLDEAVLRALAKSPAERFQSVAQMRHHLVGGALLPRRHASELVAGAHLPRRHAPELVAGAHLPRRHAPELLASGEPAQAGPSPAELSGARTLRGEPATPQAALAQPTDAAPSPAEIKHARLSRPASIADLPTMVRRLPSGAVALPPSGAASPPSLGAGSYRGLALGGGLAGGRRHTLLSAGLAALVVAAGVGTVVLLGRAPARQKPVAAGPSRAAEKLAAAPPIAPPGASRETAAAGSAAAGEPGTKATQSMAPVPNPPAATSTAPPEGGATPKAASRSSRRRKSSASPPPIAQAAPAGNGQALTRPDAQTGAGIGADSDALEGSADELKQLVTMVENESGDLRRLYADGLAKKEAGGAKLTPDDDRLKDALRDLQGAAERFNLLFQSSFSARFRNRLSRLAHPGDDHAQLQRRCKALTDKGESADQLMTRLGPAPPVHQLWQRMSRQLRRAAALCGS